MPLPAGSSCTVQYTRAIAPGDPDPLMNTFEATYRPDGFEIEVSDSHITQVLPP